MVHRGVFVGRFQPFHRGHLAAVKDALQMVEELVVVIGSAQFSHEINNPFTAGERLEMVRSALLDEGIELSRIWIVPVPDVNLHMMWVSALKGYTPRFDVVYTNEPLTRRLFLEDGYEVKPLRFHKRAFFSSTEIRRRMLSGENWENLVPRGVARLVRAIDGVNRLRDLTKLDRD